MEFPDDDDNNKDGRASTISKTVTLKHKTKEEESDKPSSWRLPVNKLKKVSKSKPQNVLGSHLQTTFMTADTSH